MILGHPGSCVTAGLGASGTTVGTKKSCATPADPEDPDDDHPS